MRVARRGERRGGDGRRARVDRDGDAPCLIDGLGHGDGAADATDAALAAFDACTGGDAPTRVAAMHAALRGTRGAVAAVVVGRFRAGGRGISLEHAAVGNIAVATCRPGERPRRLYSVEGVLGRGDPVPRVDRLELSGRSALVMHSDGVRAPSTLERRGGLLRRDPVLVAAVVYRDGGDRGDDCAVLVARPARLTSSDIDGGTA